MAMVGHGRLGRHRRQSPCHPEPRCYARLPDDAHSPAPTSRSRQCQAGPQTDPGSKAANPGRPCHVGQAGRPPHQIRQPNARPRRPTTVRVTARRQDCRHAMAPTGNRSVRRCCGRDARRWVQPSFQSSRGVARVCPANASTLAAADKKGCGAAASVGVRWCSASPAQPHAAGRWPAQPRKFKRMHIQRTSPLTLPVSRPQRPMSSRTQSRGDGRCGRSRA